MTTSKTEGKMLYPFDDPAQVREWLARDHHPVTRDAIRGIFDVRIARGDKPTEAARYALEAHVEIAEAARR